MKLAGRILGTLDNRVDGHHTHTHTHTFTQATDKRQANSLIHSLIQCLFLSLHFSSLSLSLTHTHTHTFTLTADKLSYSFAHTMSLSLSIYLSLSNPSTQTVSLAPLMPTLSDYFTLTGLFLFLLQS